jgi:serine/threonine protein kinase
VKITNAGRGIHVREIKGIERFRNDLPSDWYGFTNLDIALDAGRAREIDAIIVSDLRIFLIDIKDWHGRISSIDGRWQLNGIDVDSSPVTKITDIARRLPSVLSRELKKRPETRTLDLPKFEALVVLTGRADRSGIAEVERSKVLTIDEFVAIAKDSKRSRDTFGNVSPKIVEQRLTTPFWKEKLSAFFNAGPNSPFKTGKRRFERFIASESPNFVHPKEVYAEYEAEEEGNKNNLGMLRLWDFSKCETRFQSEEGRQEIAGREHQIFHWLRDRSEELERTLLTPKIDDPSRGTNYWEIYDRRRRLQRLTQFAATEVSRLTPTERIELARQTLHVLSGLHKHDAAHLDLGGHSIWLEAPTTVRLSHLLAARFPEARSLGTTRYQFLASVGVPDDLLGVDNGPKCRDIYLVGVSIHQLLFGKMPAGDPPEWNSEIDVKREFERLHNWLATALDVDPTRRYRDAMVALSAFNLATTAHHSPAETLDRLEHYRQTYRSQRQLVSSYPATGSPILESDRLEIWKSTSPKGDVVVKLWKKSAWGDTTKESTAILAFLERAANMMADRPVGLPTVRGAWWLGDSMAVVQDWVEGSTLEQALKAVAEVRTPLGATTIVKKLIECVELLHDAGYGHGDLKPSNIVITNSGDPVLIDILDFSPKSDGEIATGAYSPNAGNVYERDRYATTKIAEEIFLNAALTTNFSTRLAKAINLCREKEPRLATLSPLLDAVDHIIITLTSPTDQSSAQSLQKIRVSILGAETGPIVPDESYFFVRVNSKNGRNYLAVRGAVEEIEMPIDASGKLLAAKRRNIDQGKIRRVAAHEFYKFSAELLVVQNEINDLSGLQNAIPPTIIQESLNKLRDQPSTTIASDSSDSEPIKPSEELEAERIIQESSESGAQTSTNPVDVPTLWRALMDVENELTIEAIAAFDSSYDRTSQCHKIPIELETGVFEFARYDTVGVERQDRRGQWRRIGELDVQMSRPQLAFVKSTVPTQQLVDGGQRLRFISHFELQSLRRRTDAVHRILTGNGRSRDLLSVFDSRQNLEPRFLHHEIDQALLSSYELNADQQQAFQLLVNCRPTGFLQGPPGTGKTRFIAALSHYAITKGLAKNVLLSSQSHEAVNAAAEAVLSLFRKSGEQPSMLRVAMDEELASAPLRPFHTARVERGLKDKFSANFRERLSTVGVALGLPQELSDAVFSLETTIRPLVKRIEEISSGTLPDKARLTGLLETLESHLQRLELVDQQPTDFASWSEFLERLLSIFVKRSVTKFGVQNDQIKRVLDVARIGRDFSTSAPRAQRNFEGFLAGTRQIVVGTCVGLGRTSLGLVNTAFDLVIVDEAARCTSSELLVPLQAARWAILVGDHAQLKPQHKPEVVELVAARTSISKREIQRSDFERVFSTNYGKEAGARLKTQYRMLHPIGQIVSETFYPDLALKAARNQPAIDPLLLPTSLEKPLTWIETGSLGSAAFDKQPASGESRINRIEVSAILALLENWHSHESFRTWLQTQQSHPTGIGVICMYAAQRDLLRQRLRQSSLSYLLDQHVRVGTVDSYQGKENPIIMLSLVRNNEDGQIENGVRCIQQGFLMAPNRVNVAVSRAMDRLVVVGAKSRWPAGSPMHQLSIAFNRQLASGTATVLDAQELLLTHNATNQTNKQNSKRKTNSDIARGGEDG